MLPDFRLGNRRVRLNGVKSNTSICVFRANAIHLRNVAVADRAVRRREEDHDGAALRPLVFVMNDPRRVPQCELRERRNERCQSEECQE